jgi:hypothetical protein
MVLLLLALISSERQKQEQRPFTSFSYFETQMRDIPQFKLKETGCTTMIPFEQVFKGTKLDGSVNATP